MNLVESLLRADHGPKPRSRGDEPQHAGGITATLTKTPLTRG